MRDHDGLRLDGGFRVGAFWDELGSLCEHCGLNVGMESQNELGLPGMS